METGVVSSFTNIADAGSVINIDSECKMEVADGVVATAPAAHVPKSVTKGYANTATGNVLFPPLSVYGSSTCAISTQDVIYSIVPDAAFGSQVNI